MNVASRTALTVAATAVALSACDKLVGPGFGDAPGGLAACGTAPILTASPAALTDLTDVVPLGNLNPGGHTFPTDHIYLIVPRVTGGSDPVTVPVVSPGEIRLTGIASSTSTQNGVTRADYSLYFFGCADVQFYFHHIQALAPSLAASIGPIDGDCNTHSTGGASFTRCNKGLDITLHARDPIGTAGGAGNFGFDLGAYDRRTPKLAFVNQSYPDFGGNADWNTFHTVCPLDYFAADVKAALEAKLGSQGRKRTIAPLCGTIMQDVANTAQGRWLKGSAVQEDAHLALVHDNVDPTVGSISMGASVPSVPLGVYKFTAATSPAGRVNADFNQVTADGQIYCYGGFTQFGSSLHVLVQLVTATSLKIEGMSGGACGSPSTWTFSAAAVTFAR
jgi:hypothetical protein